MLRCGNRAPDVGDDVCLFETDFCKQLAPKNERFWVAHRGKKWQSGRERGNVLYHPHLDMIAVDACKLMLFGNQTYWRDIAEQHQSLALRAYSPLNFCGSDQRLKWRHLASLGWAGARHSQSPVKNPVRAVIGQVCTRYARESTVFSVPYFSPVGIVPVVGAGNGSLASAAGTLRRSSAASQSPAHSFVPLTVPTNLQPAGPFGDTCTKDLLPTFGAFGA
jgi:hypothetical protein